MANTKEGWVEEYTGYRWVKSYIVLQSNFLLVFAKPPVFFSIDRSIFSSIRYFFSPATNGSTFWVEVTMVSDNFNNGIAL